MGNVNHQKIINPKMTYDVTVCFFFPLVPFPCRLLGSVGTDNLITKRQFFLSYLSYSQPHFLGLEPSDLNVSTLPESISLPGSFLVDLALLLVTITSSDLDESMIKKDCQASHKEYIQQFTVTSSSDDLSLRTRSGCLFVNSRNGLISIAMLKEPLQRFLFVKTESMPSIINNLAI